MDITELLTKGLGKPVASFLMKLWLGEPVASIGIALVDIAASHIQDFGKRREAARHFEGLADRMVLHLKPLFEQAARSGHTSIEAISLELGLTLESRVSAEFLVERNLDPATLTRALREARPLPPGQFSAAELQLYDRALEQTARYLVQTAPMLPRFSAAAVAAQLQRLSHLGELIGKIYESMSRVEQLVAASMPGSKFARFEADYREAVSRNVDRLELLGVDVTEEHSRRYELSVAYISLSLREDAKDEDETRLEPAEVVLDGLLPESGQLLIRGDAGSGKSTLLKWVAWTSALLEGPKRERDTVAHLLDRTARPRDLEKGRPDARDSWRSRIPFLVRLRDCRDGRLPPLDELTLHTARELGKPPEGWVKSVLEEGRGLLLIDGVDEVPHKLRRAVREDIEGLVNTYTRSTYLLTTRPAAIPRDWLKSLGFRSAEVSPLSPVDRDQLIERWHKAVARQLDQVGRPSTELADLARELKARLRENPAIARLATNPLLAAAICALHRQRNRRLPETQAELCEDLCKMLLHQREAETPNLSVEPAAYRELTYPQKKRIVEALAHDMVLNGRSVLDKAEVQRKIGKALERMGRSERGAAEVLEGFIERSGMVREMSPGKLDFIHNTFKEYLAAEVFAAGHDDGLLARNAIDPGWQQVLVFAAARGEPGFVEKLIENVLGGGGEAPKASGRKHRSGGEERQRRLMAVRLEAAALELRPELRQQVGKLRQELFPPATMAEAEALASAGDTVVPFLRYRRTDSARKVAACVRALRLIDSAAAREVLKEYMREWRWAVIEELARVINPLELERVRHALVTGEDLSAGLRSQISDLSPLADFHHSSLQSLDLRETQVQDLTPLSHLSSLQILYLIGTQVQDLTPLSHLSSLQILNLSGTQVQDLTPLSHLSSLRILNLIGIQVQDLSPLAPLSSLQILDLSGTQVQDLSALSNLSSLQNLDLSETPVQNLSALAHLASLQSLHLIGTQVQHLSPLSRLSSLQNLNLSGTQVQDLSALSNLSSLQSLYLSGTQVQDLSPLAQLSSLQSLNLSGTQVQDLSPLAQLSSLQSLNLSGTQVQDLSPLAQLSSLQSLNLSGTQVQDLSALSNLSSLQSLNLSGTQIRELFPLSHLSALQSLDLIGAQVQDLSPLSSLTSLQSLNLIGTQVQDLSPLSHLSALQSLDLIGTQVQDLSPLSHLSALRTLYLSGSQAQDLSALENLIQGRKLQVTR